MTNDDKRDTTATPDLTTRITESGGEFKRGIDVFAPPPEGTPVPTAPVAMAGPPAEQGSPAPAAPPADPPSSAGE